MRRWPAPRASSTKGSDALDRSGRPPVVQALILAGGEGTRLRPLTMTVPKPVLPLANRPFISYMIDWLQSHGVEEIVLSCGFLASEVQDVLGDGEAGGARLRYSTAEQPLGT